jgi:hypothetical protein
MVTRSCVIRQPSFPIDRHVSSAWTERHLTTFASGVDSRFELVTRLGIVFPNRLGDYAVIQRSQADYPQ